MQILTAPQTRCAAVKARFTSFTSTKVQILSTPQACCAADYTAPVIRPVNARFTSLTSTKAQTLTHLRRALRCRVHGASDSCSQNGGQGSVHRGQGLGPASCRVRGREVLPARFTSFTSTKVQVLTPEALRARAPNRWGILPDGTRALAGTEN